MTNILFFFIILSACTERIEIETDDSPPVVVIYGVLTDELKSQEVKISRSSPYFDDEPNKGISGANVTVRSSDDEVYLFRESNKIQGLYYSQERFSAKEGIVYSLTVEVDFDKNGVPDKYEAETTIFPVPTIDSLTIEPVELFGHKNYLLYVHAQDPPEKNFYLFHVFYNDSLVTGQITEFVVSDDRLFNNQYMKGDIYLFDDDDVSEWETGPEENRKNPFYLKPGDTVSVEFSAISEGYFNFINQCQREKKGENPMFGGPASNIDTNISNGGVGYFTGYKISGSQIVYSPTP
jgi:hypothetical protein